MHLWTAPGPEVFRVYAYLASHYFSVAVCAAWNDLPRAVLPMVRSAPTRSCPQLRRLRLLAHGDSWLLAEHGPGIALPDFEFAEVHQGSGWFSRPLNARQNTLLARYAFGVRNPLAVGWPTIPSRRPGMQPTRRLTPSRPGQRAVRSGQVPRAPARRPRFRRTEPARPPDGHRAPDGGALRRRLLPSGETERSLAVPEGSPASAGTRSRKRNGPARAFRSGTGTAVHNLGLRSAPARGTGPGS